MTTYEYRVVPAPQKGEKAQGVKGAEAKFANTLETVINELARKGWEYQRAEMLPSTERAGLTGSATEWRNLLIFRRPARIQPQARTQPQAAAPAPRQQAAAPASPTPRVSPFRTKDVDLD